MQGGEITLPCKTYFRDNHKIQLDSYFKSGKFLNSEFTFTNMFIWQQSYNIRYAEIDGNLCIFSHHGTEPESVSLTTFTGDTESTVTKLLTYFEYINSPVIIRLFGAEQKQIISETFPDKFNFEEDPNSYDYVYSIPDLISLPGGKYHSKRNHINKFQNLYQYEYHTMTKTYCAQCREMFQRWSEAKRDTIANIDEQLTAVNRLLDNWENLDISGGCITVDGHMVAFSFGEVLCEANSIIVIHLEHADVDYRGSFPMINQQFLENEWASLTYVNREEDMGIMGLRNAKKSYKPCLMVKKYIASLK